MGASRENDTQFRFGIDAEIDKWSKTIILWNYNKNNWFENKYFVEEKHTAIGSNGNNTNMYFVFCNWAENKNKCYELVIIYGIQLFIRRMCLRNNDTIKLNSNLKQQNHIHSSFAHVFWFSIQSRPILCMLKQKFKTRRENTNKTSHSYSFWGFELWCRGP